MLHRSQNASANAAERLATIRIAAKGCLHFALKGAAAEDRDLQDSLFPVPKSRSPRSRQFSGFRFEVQCLQPGVSVGTAEVSGRACISKAVFRFEV